MSGSRHQVSNNNSEDMYAIGKALTQLVEHNIDTAETRALIVKNPEDALILASIFSTLYNKNPKLNLLDKNMAALTLISEQTPEYLLSINSMLLRLKHTKPLFIQPNVERILSLAQYGMGLNLWWGKLIESQNANQMSFERLCQSIEILNQESVIEALLDLLIKGNVYPHAEKLVVFMTVDRFSKILAICENTSINSVDKSTHVTHYLKSLVQQQRKAFCSYAKIYKTLECEPLSDQARLERELAKDLEKLLEIEEQPVGPEVESVLGVENHYQSKGPSPRF